MLTDQNTIIGLLTGSVLTLIGKWVIELVNNRISFNREITKITYQRKLEVAEKAIAYYWSYINKVQELKISLSTLVKSINQGDNSELNLEFIQSHIGKNGALLDDLNDKKYIEINSIHLYYDLEDKDAWSEADLTQMVECIAKISEWSSNAEFWLESYNTHKEHGDPEDAEDCLKQFTNNTQWYVSAVEEFIKLIEKNRVASHAIAKKIKQQLKK